MAGSRLLAVVSFAILASFGCSEPERPNRSAFGFIPASPELLAKCRATAAKVGYPVPCPTRVPRGLFASGGRAGCELDVIGAGGEGECAKSWRGWVVGSSEAGSQHLVVVASPRPITNDAKVVNGPAWYPGARVRLLRRLTVDGRQMHAVYAPGETNDGSAFTDHVVLIWTAGGHTYAVGFHDVNGIRQTLELDIALVRGIKLVTP